MYLGSLQIGWITSDWYADTPIPYKGDKNRRRRDNKKKDKRTNGLPTSEEGKCKKEIKEDSSGHSVTSTIKEDNINTKENVNSRMSGGSENSKTFQDDHGDLMNTNKNSTRNISRLSTSEESKCQDEKKEDLSGRMSGGSVNLTPIQDGEDSMRTKEKSSRNTSGKFKQKKNS